MPSSDQNDINIGVSDSDSENHSKTEDLPTKIPPMQYSIPTDNPNIYRPNNAMITARLLSGFNVDLPVIKLEGHNKSTKNSYWFLPAFTVKKSSRNIFIYYKERKKWIVKTPEDLLRAKKYIEDFLKEKLYWLSQKRTDITFDLFKPKIVIKDFGLRNPHLRQLLKRNEHFENEVGKHVYDNYEWEYKKDEHVSNEITNYAIRNWSPELVKELEDVRGLLGGMIPQNTATSNAILLMTKILERLEENTRPKESWFGKLMKRVIGR